MSGNYVCERCREPKPVGHFAPHPSQPHRLDLRSHICKACRRKDAQARRHRFDDIAIPLFGKTHLEPPTMEEYRERLLSRFRARRGVIQ